jgi:hypothetical protein
VAPWICRLRSSSRWLGVVEQLSQQVEPIRMRVDGFEEALASPQQAIAPPDVRGGGDLIGQRPDLGDDVGQLPFSVSIFSFGAPT